MNQEKELPVGKKIAFVSFLSLIVLVLVGLGVITGYYIASRPFKKLVVHYDKFHTVGSLYSSRDVSGSLTDIQRDDFYKVYSEKEKIKEKAHQITWVVPNILTPFLGTGPRPGNHHNTHITPMQFRAASDPQMPKPDNEYRIFITGGSTAFSTGAPDQNSTISAFLEKKLNASQQTRLPVQFKVYTIANPSWASTHERIIIENRLCDLEPNLVISISGNNDVHWGGLGRNVMWYRTYVDDFFVMMLDYAYKLGGRKKAPNIVNIAKRPVNPRLVAERLKRNLLLNSYVLSMKKIPYVFCLQPTLAMTRKQLTPREKDFLVNQAYFSLCYGEIVKQLKSIQKDNFNFCNLTGCFDKMGQEGKTNDLFLDSYHFGDKGNALIADMLYSYLKDSFWGSQTKESPEQP
ncbi:MAG: hypothetical protein GY757_46165 [bacterium]|nr:hypothetical protein [bacterium]